MPGTPKIIFAGNRDIAVQILELLISEEVYPSALLLPTPERGSHNQELINLCSFLQEDQILYGNEFRQPEGLQLLSGISPDYIICIHFLYIVPDQVLSIPKVGVLNLHPAYLPYNRGWHTPSWAILSETPIGGTLHFMDEDIDTGDIIHQKEVKVLPSDTADILYKRILETEYEVFKEALPTIINFSFKRKSQKNIKGSIHKKEDLFSEDLRKLDLDKEVRSGELLKKLKALTTNRVDESAYFEIDGKKYYVQVKIIKKENHEK
jgi:methionyl-tRNA formyltransferase